MIKKLDFNKLIGYFINRSDRFVVIRNNRDWTILVYCFLIILLIVLIGSGYVFWSFQYKNLTENDIQDNEVILAIKKTVLNSALENLEKKEKLYEEILKIQPLIQDPSI